MYTLLVPLVRVVSHIIVGYFMIRFKIGEVTSLYTRATLGSSTVAQPLEPVRTCIVHGETEATSSVMRSCQRLEPIFPVLRKYRACGRNSRNPRNNGFFALAIASSRLEMI